MTALALRIPDDYNRSLDNMTQEETLRLFSECFGITVAGVVKAAEIVELWRQRGWDLSDLEDIARGWLHRLKLISQGQLSPQLAVTFHAQSSWLDRFAHYPRDEQDRIASDEGLELLTIVNGRQTTLAVRPSLLLKIKEQRSQIFDRDHIRTVSEQSLWLDDQKKKRERANIRPKAVADFKIDRELGEFIYGKRRWPKSVAKAILDALS